MLLPGYLSLGFLDKHGRQVTGGIAQEMIDTLSEMGMMVRDIIVAPYTTLCYNLPP